MKWVKASDVAIESGSWTICKCRVGGKFRYSLHMGKGLIGTYGSAETAKEAAMEREAANG